jgi:nucleoid-associated protein YgaU
MSELLPTHVPRESRRMILALACALPFYGLCGGASAGNVPAGLRACAAESDPGQRLDCYDREMKRLLAPAARPAEPASAAPAAASPGPAGREAAPSPAIRAPEAPVAAAAGANAAAEKPAAPRRSSVWTIFTGGGHVTARIVRLDRSPDSLVLYLDNGQVWRQIGRASGELSLRKGDKVTIAKHMGSYWLSSRYVADMRVRPQAR